MRAFSAIAPTIQTGHIPAPVGGLNTVAAGSNMPEGDCVLLQNLMSGQFGLQTRSGWKEVCPSGPGAPVRSIIPFHGSKGDGSYDALYAVTRDAIYRVHPDTGIAHLWEALADSTGQAGRGIFTTITNAANTNTGIYCDEQNGYYYYSESIDGGIEAPYLGFFFRATSGGGGDITGGADPNKWVFPLLWKNRLWFVERDSARAWYLDLSAFKGAATQFNFGSQFRNGGTLVGLWSWTYDGGNGIDDSLVAISSNGDVVIYQGTDPASPSTFKLQGVWSVGAVPSGRQIATAYGGDILILSLQGLIPLSRLVTGNIGDAQYSTQKIQNLWSLLARNYRYNHGWSIGLHPADSALLVNIPVKDEDGAGIQLAMSTTTGAWSQYSGLPILCSGIWHGDLHFGIPDGRVGVATGAVDDLKFADPSLSTPVPWACITRYENLDDSRWKQVQTIRPYVDSDIPFPQFEARALYDYTPYLPTGDLLTITGANSTWDVAKWDQGIWGGDRTLARGTWGASGIGRGMALALRGNATSKTTFIGADVTYQVGGALP